MSDRYISKLPITIPEVMDLQPELVRETINPLVATKAETERWLIMAARLQQSMLSVSDLNVRLAILNQLSEQLGSHGYPGFLKLLMLLSHNGDPKAKAIIAETLATAVQRSDLPSGNLNAWGGSRMIRDQDLTTPISASHLLRSFWGQSPRRDLGPIEYLTVWFGQRTQRPYLTDEAYASALCDLLSLFNCSDMARQAYAQKILSDVQSPSEGTFTRLTKQRLYTLAQSWFENRSPQQIVTEVQAL